MSQVMDEALIDEVANHGVIFNRQKYYLNGTGPGGGGNGSGNKYETKDEAWQTIAMKLRTDVETCKKRWKYLRERYVSQRKQCDPPVYEHLSRPYLEKMKFLDQHIQPRKSYRNVPSFLTSPHSANSSTYGEYNMDSKSNSSLKSLNPFGGASQQYHHHHHHHTTAQEQAQAMNALTTAAAALEGSSNGSVKIEADVFRDFAAAVASQQLHISQSQMHHHHHPHHQQHQQVAAVAAAMAADSSQNFQDHFREGNGLANGGATAGVANGTTGGIPSSSSSMKSPLSSPLHPTNGQNGSGQSSSSTPQQAAAHSSTGQMGHSFNGCQNGGDLDADNNNGFHAKKARLQSAMQMPNGNGANTASNASNNHYTDDTDDESDDNSSGGNTNNIMHPQTMLHEHSPQFDNSASTTNQQRNSATGNGNNASSGGSNNNHNLNSNNNNNHSSQQHNMFPANAANDFLFQLYQTLPHQPQGGRSSNHDSHQQQQPQQQQHHHAHHQFGKASASSPLGPPAGQHAPQRSSEQLLGELVTTELLKMHGDKRKQVQKRILEILFFDD